MEKRYSEIISAYQLKNLCIWRSRYSEKAYPYKVALNLLYGMLIGEKMWDEIHDSFNMSILGWGNSIFQNFHEAHGFVLNRSDSIAKSRIRPIVEREYKTRDSIANIDWSSIRNRVIKAQNGDNKEVQEIEADYFLFTSGVELIYAWLAFRYLGTDQESAFMELTGLQIDDIDYSSYQSLLNSFGKASVSYYKPLPNLFLDSKLAYTLNNSHR
jgi:hypothetical protein